MRRSHTNHHSSSPAHNISAILDSPQWTHLARELGLTPRQADVVRLALQAKHNKEIATLLGLQASTVRMHLRYVYSQLGICDRMGLALRILPLLCGEHRP